MAKLSTSTVAILTRPYFGLTTCPTGVAVRIVPATAAGDRYGFISIKTTATATTITWTKTTVGANAYATYAPQAVLFEPPIATYAKQWYFTGASGSICRWAFYSCGEAVTF